jgi:hypothetical protein
MKESTEQRNPTTFPRRACLFACLFVAFVCVAPSGCSHFGNGIKAREAANGHMLFQMHCGGCHNGKNCRSGNNLPCSKGSFSVGFFLAERPPPILRSSRPFHKDAAVSCLPSRTPSAAKTSAKSLSICIRRNLPKRWNPVILRPDHNSAFDIHRGKALARCSVEKTPANTAFSSG